ncbi:MAG: hypothetical protein ACKOVB_10715 [Terrabacter sp.]
MAASRALVCALTRGRSDGSSPSKRRPLKFGESCTNGRIAAGEAPIRFITRNNVTVAGVPAKVVGTAGCAEPSRTMDQMLSALGF